MPTRPAALALTAGVLAAACAATAPASAQPRWDGRGPDGPGAYDLAGPGVPFLDPELRETRRGRAFVRRGFDWNHDGLVQVREARAADRAWRDGDDLGRDPGRDSRRDWGRDDADAGRGWRSPPPPPPSYEDRGGWDRGGRGDRRG